jgi:hypothetical protein
LDADPGRLPFVEVVPSETGRFRSRDYFSRLLEAMNEPLIDSKIIRDPRGVHAPVWMTGRRRSRLCY